MEYKKNFDIWNIQKQKLDTSKPLHFAEREIWWCKLGVNIGSEQDGKGNNFERPVLVIKKINIHICWILPFSSKKIEGEYRFDIKDLRMQLILSQIRTVDSRRFLRRISIINLEVFNEIRLRINNILR